MSTLSHLKYVYHHVFYPPKLPQSDDTNPEALHALHAILQNVLVKYTKVIGGDDTKLRNCYTMLENFRQARQPDGSLIVDHMESVLHAVRMSNGEPLSKAFNSVNSDSLRPVMVLEIRAQNAGVIVSAKAGKSCVFELFELSADCGSVMAAEGRLCRSFPGSTIEVANDRLDDPAFRASLIEAFCKMDSEFVNETVPQVSKASTTVPEIRDTVHPRLVTELIREILRAVGQDVQIPLIQKHSRERCTVAQISHAVATVTDLAGLTRVNSAVPARRQAWQAELRQLQIVYGVFARANPGVVCSARYHT